MASFPKLPSASQSLLKARQRYVHSNRQSPQSCAPHHLHDVAPWPQGPYPSPHEILGAEPGRPYSKKSFHRLVKLYHPDIYGVNEKEVAGIPLAKRLERYRLVIEANEILSDPQKRLLYERYGLGWVLSKYGTQSTPCSHYYAARGSRTHGGRPSAQAAPERQFPIFASNATIAIVLVAMAMTGAIVQLERARKAQWEFKMRDVALQEAISMDLKDLAVRLEGKPRDTRILEFLARREIRNWKNRENPFLGFDPSENICRH
ncbi:DnaJ domain-containing protein [Colletotrichum graminicola]|uniref:DnaJ domain-containing protein n=1 Tax=Colletotrichum graminicola (strain M1.001 / M2 / FGSC 10212) TaxID=645133 RepID=E3QPU4_COLGM|nr:DnaJ domain-containing protein [Colletotrichum graminicola M1.001]EFQ32871.1 DnaJ domain-containing protein [Colletotrichum graminicola M1.001]WDK16520.1 DnaJ domain-containing protein [Colletotrichum graminicola]